MSLIYTGEPDVIELIVEFRSSVLLVSIGLSTEQIGVFSTLGAVFLMESQMQLMLPARMQLIAVMKTCSSSSPFGRESASATTLALPRR